MPMLVPVASHDQNSHVSPGSDQLDLTNAMVLLTISSVPHNAKDGTNGIT